VDTLQDRLALAKAQLLQQGPRIVQTQAQTGLALVALRIQEQGLPGRPQYSTNLFPTFLFAKRALNAGGRDYIKKNKLGTWGQFRAAQGRRSDVVDLSYSNRMWRSLTVAPAGGVGALFSAKVVAADQESADKVRHNTERYGDFLNPLPAEAAEVAQVGKTEIGRIINQALQ
jgi:hypothetical protein